MDRKKNISRTIEGCTATNKRHYAATSSDLIQNWLASKNYKALLKFVLETVLNILRDKLRVKKEVRELAQRVDDLAMVELCVHHKVIDYADFIQIVQVVNVSYY